MEDINVLRLDYEIQVARANKLEQRLKEVLEENDRLRLELIILRNNQIIFADCNDVLQKVK